MADIHDVSDYIISRLVQGGVPLNQLKLQKLLYYSQAWHLAFYGKPMFNGRFQAWVHGPVNREVFDRFRQTHALYSPMQSSDIRAGFNSDAALQGSDKGHAEAVLNVYAPLTGDQLEEMTHRETPWIAARGNLPPDARCENEIDEGMMAAFYAARLK